MSRELHDSDATFGPWLGVPKSKQAICAVDGCQHRGKPHRCLYDGGSHHHGCIHYDCAAAEATRHGLTFRAGGWGWLCDSHYGELKDAQAVYNAARLSAARQLAAL